MFTLHSRLASDTIEIGQLPLCLIRLHKDANYPWIVLIPKQANITEIHQLSETDQQQLMRESSAIAQAMEKALTPDKMNVASLGNMVSQLHLHHVARFTHDKAWPGPIWGAHSAIFCSAETLAEKVNKWQQILSDLPEFKASN